MEKTSCITKYKYLNLYLCFLRFYSLERDVCVCMSKCVYVFVCVLCACVRVIVLIYRYTHKCVP